MSEFKVGDRIRPVAKKEAYWARDWPEATVISVEGRFPRIKRDDGAQGDACDGWWELVPNEEPAPSIDAHYTKYAIQPMEFSLANGLDPAQHTVIKYVLRYRDKHGVRDLRAAIRVLELMIEREEKANG